MNNKRIKSKLDEKIKKIRDEIPNIKSKYEIEREEEIKKEEEEIKNNNENNNEEQVNDWFQGIFS